MKKRMVSLVLVLSMVFSLLPAMAVETETNVAGIVPNETEITLKVGETYTLGYTLTPEGATAKVLFSTMKEDDVVAVEEATGVITTKRAGSTYVYLWLNKRAGSPAAKCRVVVEAGTPATDFEIPEKVEIKQGETYQLTPKTVPAGSNPTQLFTYKSEGGGTASVSSSGLIKGLSPGGTTIVVKMGKIEKRCEVFVDFPEGYVPPEHVCAIEEGWYVLRLMKNFIGVDSGGRVVLDWKNPAPTYYVQEHFLYEKTTGRWPEKIYAHTIKTADGKYLALPSGSPVGAQIITQTEPYYWDLSLELTDKYLGQFYGLYNANEENPYVCAISQTKNNSNGSKIVMVDNKSYLTPEHGTIQFIPAESSAPKQIAPAVVSAYDPVKPLNLRPSSISKDDDVFVLGMQMGASTTADVKAMYGEPDDIWYETFNYNEDDGEDIFPGWDGVTTFYFYRNSWKDLMIIGFALDCVTSVYTNAEVNFGGKTLPARYRVEYVRDEYEGAVYATWVTGVTYMLGGVSYTSPSFDKIYYYVLNGYLANKGWKMMTYSELESYSLGRYALKRQQEDIVWTQVKSDRLEYRVDGFGPWHYLPLYNSDNKIRESMKSGKYNTMAIGHIDSDMTSVDWKDMPEKHLGSLVLQLSNRSNVGSPSTKAPPATAVATPSPTKLAVNGKAVSIDAYAINQNNYIKLRDMAYIINGTDKNFEVQWDGAKNAINLISGKAYTPTKSDMAPGDGQTKNATLATSAIYVDGVAKPLTAYVIGQSNYFKLRDVMQAFYVEVGYDGATATATLDTTKVVERPARSGPVTVNTQPSKVNEGVHKLYPSSCQGFEVCVSGGSKNDKAEVLLWENGTEGHYMIQWTAVGDDKYTLTFQHSGKKLTAGTKAGDVLYQGAGSEFYVYKDSLGCYRIKDSVSGLYVTMSGDKVKNGVKLVLGPESNDGSQSFALGRKK